jgi:putative flippase GtrA
VSDVPRQFFVFVGVGLVAAVVHYGALAGLVEFAKVDPVPATLVGYGFGSLVSYALNRRHTYRSQRPHCEAVWRFILVAASGFVLTGFFMALFTRVFFAPYFPAQIVTTLIILFWHFLAHRLWTFAARKS